uniref:Uncharacterized protein n=1 Tax=viral metagenome TaxID=1070528 RepID=A0A6M3LSW0_9ZZZZ
MKMTRDEESLLLFLETRAVDHDGKVSTEHMNASDMEVAKRWNVDHFICFGRLPSELVTAKTNRGRNTHWVILSPGAFGHASQLRAERADRGTARLRTELEPYKLLSVVASVFDGVFVPFEE